MRPTIPAIETVYKGNRFRSRTEAKWAVFFDQIGLRYEFEPQGVALPAGAYLPDFWLPDAGAWFEVKGSWEAVGSLQKYGQLAERGDKILIVGGQPTPDHQLAMIGPEPWPLAGVEIGCRVAGTNSWLWPWRLRFCRDGGSVGVMSDVPLMFSEGKSGGALSIGLTGKLAQPRICTAELREAGMARFEHGESGARRS